MGSAIDKRAKALEVLQTGLKTCNKCGKEKPLTEFNSSSGVTLDGHLGHCKECQSTKLKLLARAKGAKPYGFKTLKDNIIGLKVCNKCGILKPIEDYSPVNNRRDRVAGATNAWCRECCKLYAREPAVRNRSRDNYLKREFGVDSNWFNETIALQNGKCSICGVVMIIGDTVTKPCVDHCHSTLTVRGIICTTCNKGLGCFRDSINSLQAAIDYLGKTE